MKLRSRKFIMILPGDYVKVLNGYYKGEIGIIKGFDGFSFKINLLKRALEIKLDDKEFEILDDKEIEEKEIKIISNDGTELLLKDIDLRYTSNSLRNNGYIKGLYSLGKYYAKNEYPEKHYNDYFTREILKLKNFNRKAAENIANIFSKFINESEVLEEIAELIEYICFIPTIHYRNHVEQWGAILCENLGVQDISHIIEIPFHKRKLLKNYKFQYARGRYNIINGAFQIKENEINLKNKCCLILDDVCTTGLQINELTTTLVSEGVREVYAFVIGRAKY